jgi:hypothetical protein
MQRALRASRATRCLNHAASTEQPQHVGPTRSEAAACWLLAGGHPHDQPSQQQQEVQQRALRAAYRKARLRWHPDKFMLQYGHMLPPAQVEAAQDRLAGICAALNRQWADARDGVGGL